MYSFTHLKADGSSMNVYNSNKSCYLESDKEIVRIVTNNGSRVVFITFLAPGESIMETESKEE